MKSPYAAAGGAAAFWVGFLIAGLLWTASLYIVPGVVSAIVTE